LSGATAKLAAVREGIKRREEVIEKKAVALNLRRDIKSLQAALEDQLEKLGSLTLTHRPPVVDVSAEVTELSQTQDETAQKQAILESLRQTTGSAPVVKEVDQELAALQSRKRTTTIRIGSKTAVARPEMPGTVGLYAAIDRLRMSLTAKQNELKTIEEQVGTQGADWGMNLPITKLATFAGAIAGGALLLYLLFMRSPRTHSFSNFGWLVVLGAVAFIIYLVRLGSEAEARSMQRRGKLPSNQTDVAPGRAVEVGDAGVDEVRCPKCGSAQLSVNRKGFGGGGACCGALLLGPLGALCGFAGANKVLVTCLKCGHQWSRG
jgi:hypothetical protein